jgi:hypothetical protein
MASSTAALCLLVATSVDASGFEFSPKYAQSLSREFFLEAPYTIGTAETPTEACADWTIEVDHAGSHFAARTVDFIARQRPLPIDIAEIITRRLGDLLE